MSEATLPATPYKGLIPYSEEDAPFFFGREREQEIITSNLLASRLTLLYGASGVGKSSVLSAGVAQRLRHLTHQNLIKRGRPKFVVVVFSSWRDDPVEGLAGRVQDSVAQALNGHQLEPAPRSPILADTLQAWTERIDGELFIILDQFEEYFLYHPIEDGAGTFAVELPRAVNRSDLRVNFLISLREDALAKLDRFKGRIPHLFDNYLRIDHLDREAARAAIEKPLEQYNGLRAVKGREITIEPALTEAVLEQVKTGVVVLGQAGRGMLGDLAGTAKTEARIETPYLQLVMTRLWDEEMRAGSATLQLQTLERLGGADRIVRRHLDATLKRLPSGDRATAARVFRYLITPSGTKIAYTIPDLAEYTGLAPTRLSRVMEELAGRDVRIVRSVDPPPDQPDAPRYEIFHDVLASAILDWRTRYLQTRRQRLLTGILFVPLILIVALGAYAVMQQNQVARARMTAQQAEMAAQQAEMTVQQAEITVQQAETAAQQAEMTAQQIENSARQQQDVLAAIQLANNAETEAFRNLDPGPLHAFYTGEALEDRMNYLAYLQSEGLYIVNRLHEIQPQSLSISPDGTQAEVRRIETWSSEFYTIDTQQCYSRLPEHQVPQTIHLQLRNNAWVVYRLEFDSPSPDPVAC